ncbi:MAG TPA: ABC transporter permease subunit [Hadesarchaea archaeon]|nr:ABC transporter permease subunit [Hadesarchaea archaeon]
MSEQLFDLVVRSLWISGTALLFSLLWSVPISLTLGLRKFKGRQVLISIFNALLGIPTVALGLTLYLLFSRGGALGFLGVLYTPTAIVIGQALLITPIVVSLLTSAIESVNPGIRDLAKTLGASERQASLAVLGEARKGGILAGVAAFNRAVAELGIALMVGGNIAGTTRVMTTEIARGVATGEMLLSIQLTGVLLLVVFGLTFLTNLFRRD